MSNYARDDVPARLEYLRGEIAAERISFGELAELQQYGDMGLIPDHDLELMEWAGLPEPRHTWESE